jgi:nucleoside-diphosphate-sugar epimerase
MKNILITGSNGYIGSQLTQTLSTKYNCIGINRLNFDLTDNYETKKWFNNQFFDIIIHTAIKGGSRLTVDNYTVIDHNIKMYLNLLDCKDHYNKFINIGSGAELWSPFSPYGLSKRAIFESIQDKNNFYSLRIFGLFNSKEINTRFIKSNLYRYINKQNLLIFKNKFMDFIYWDDFIEIIKHYIDYTILPKNIDCVYEKKYTLLDIAHIINSLSNIKVEIDIIENSNIDTPYTGCYNDLSLTFKGLHKGIVETYNELIK